MSTASQSKVIERLEELGILVRDCPGCKPFYEAENPLWVIAPRHQASTRCESGGHPHCTCDRCF